MNLYNNSIVAAAVLAAAAVTVLQSIVCIITDCCWLRSPEVRARTPPWRENIHVMNWSAGIKQHNRNIQTDTGQKLHLDWKEPANKNIRLQVIEVCR